MKAPGFGVDFGVTVVQPAKFYECPITQPAAFLQPDKYARAGFVLPLEMTHVAGVTYVLGVATGVTPSSVELDGGRSLTCDAIVVCTGLYYPFLSPARTGESYESRAAFVRAFAPKIGAANTIVIGGGGPVGCEMAGVVRTLNPTAKIKLVCQGQKPMDQWPAGRDAKSTIAMRSRMTALNIDVLANETVEGEASLERTEVRLVNASVTIEADAYLPMFAQWNTGFVTASLPGATDKSGRILVDRYLLR